MDELDAVDDAIRRGDTARVHAVLTPELLSIINSSAAEHEDGGTLSLAVAHGRLDAMRLLLEQGCDPNAAPASARPLHVAVSDLEGEQALHAVRLLLEFGADASLLDDVGRTALALAEDWEVDDKPLAELLRGHAKLQTALDIGVRVRVHGLQRAPQHNGLCGRVVDFDALTGRFGVRIEGSHDTGLRVKPANLSAI